MRDIKGSDIINFLEKRFSLKLPSYGVLAGQAVASAYFELTKTNFMPVYNDIDVFIYDRYFETFKEYDNKNIQFLDKMDVSILNDYPETMELPRFNFEIKNPYKILDTTREGLINRIMISENVSGSRIINGFDLNCVQIGIDLSNKRLFKTQEFNDYVKTGVLKVVSYASPHHTAIRLMSKKHISNKEDNIEKEMMKIGTFIELDNLWIKEGTVKNDFGYFPFFGIKRFNDFEKFPDLKKYFDIYSHEEFDIFQLSPDFKTYATRIDRDINKILNDNKRSVSKFSLSEKEKLYLVHKFESLFFNDKKKLSTFFMRDIKIKTLESIFGKLRFKNLSKDTLDLFLKNIEILSLINYENKNVLLTNSDEYIIKLINNINRLFEYKNYEKKRKAEKFEVTLDDSVMVFYKIESIQKYLKCGGNIEILNKEDFLKNKFYSVRFLDNFSSHYFVFTVKRKEIIPLNGNKNTKFIEKKMVLIKEIVFSGLFNKIFKDVPKK